MAHGPQRIGSVLSELMSCRGFARLQASRALESAWREAAGELAARDSRVGAIRRGRLEILVANSTVAQELTFRKPALLAALAKALPHEAIGELRFRVGPIH